MGFLNRLTSWSVGFALLMVVWAGTSTSSVVVPDVFHELSQFRELRATGNLPEARQFSYTATQDQVIHPGWATGAVLDCFMVATGWDGAGLVVLKYLLCFGIGISCHGFAVRKGVSLPIFAILAFIAIGIAIPLGFAEVKASLFSAAGVIALLHLIAADRRCGGYWIWGAVPLMIVWCNLHEGAILGLLIMAVYCLSRFAESYREWQSRNRNGEHEFYLPVVLLMTSIATLANPDGWKLAAHFFAVCAKSQGGYGDDLPLWQAQPILVQMLFLITVGISAYGIYRVRPWPIFESITLLLTCVLAINHQAYAPLYLVTWICMTAPLIEQSVFGDLVQSNYSRFSHEIAVTSLAIGLVCFGAASQSKSWEIRLPDEPLREYRLAKAYPIAATEFLREKDFVGNLFVPYDVGSYVTWRLYPKVKVSADSRLGLAYAVKTLKANRNFYRAEHEWIGRLNKSTDAVLVPIQAPVYQAMSRSIERDRLGWRQVYCDNRHAIFVRAGTEVAEAMNDHHNSK